MVIRLILLLSLLLPLAVLDAAETQTVGSPAHIRVVRSGVTTDSTQATGTAGIPAGRKTFFGEVVCTAGACTQTQAIYGAMSSTAANGILLCTLTLSGTPRAQDACPVLTAVFPYYYVITTSTTGTSATGAVYASY